MPKLTFFHHLKPDIEEIRILLQDLYNLGYVLLKQGACTTFVLWILEQYSLKECQLMKSMKALILFLHIKMLISCMKFHYVALKYDGSWWFGLVQKQDIAQNDILVSFSHPHGPSQFFHWPTPEYSCWVPLGNISLKLEVPTTNNGRQYKIASDEMSFLVALDLWKLKYQVSYHLTWLQNCFLSICAV